jgi:hypothetical protein
MQAMTLEDLLGLSFEASIFFIVFKLGTAANAQSIFFLFERPSLLLRSLLSMSIIMPACAVALAEAFDKTPVKWALVTLAISPVPPFLPIKQINAGGSAPHAISVLVIEALAEIVFVPGGSPMGYAQYRLLRATRMQHERGGLFAIRLPIKFDTLSVDLAFRKSTRLRAWHVGKGEFVSSESPLAFTITGGRSGERND